MNASTAGLHGMISVSRGRRRCVSFLILVVLGLPLSRPSALAVPNQGAHAASSPDLVRSLLPSVVNVTARGTKAATADAQAGDDQAVSVGTRTEVGSGFVIDPAGLISTNWHVVNGAYDITVTFDDGSHLPATVVNAMRLRDIAILKVEPVEPLTPIRWGDSDAVKVGNPVLAVGNPLGIGTSLTAGVVSALNRDLSETPYDNFIQTDASINHGNSGGPLFDMAGAVIGMNTALVSPTSGSVGLGFALPSNDVRLIVERLLRYGWLRASWFGARLQRVTPDIAAARHMTRAEGAIVTVVNAGGSAAQAGLQVGDIVVRVDGSPLVDERAVLRDFAMSPIGREVSLVVRRGRGEQTINVRLQEWSRSDAEARDAPISVSRPRRSIRANLGLTLAPLPDSDRVKYGPEAEPGGVLITAVDAGSDAAERTVAAGDVILRVDEEPVLQPAAIWQTVEAARRRQDGFLLILVLSHSAGTGWTVSHPVPRWVPLRITTGDAVTGKPRTADVP